MSLSLAGGFARDHVRKVEAGDIQNPSADFLSGIADLLGVSLDWLIDGRGETPDVERLQGAAERVRRIDRTGTEG